MDFIENNIEEILSKMTLAEKVGQLNQIPSPKEDDEEIFKRIRNGEIGSFIMSTTAFAGNDGDRATCGELLNKLQKIAVEESRLGIPLIFGRDVIHGHHTVMPIPLGSAASFNEKLVKECYRAVGREAALDGVHWTFSPMLDMSRDPRWGRCVEGPGEDPYLGSKMARAIVEGFQGDDLSEEDSIVACAKHYIGYGASEGGRDYHRTEISDYTLRNWYLPAFKAAVDSCVGTVMCSFNDISGQPVTSSYYFLTELLKEELGFDGYIVSDWGSVAQLMDHGVAKDEKQAAEKCINAGLDMEMCTECYFKNLIQLVNEGKINETQIDEAVRRILRIKLKAGLFEHPYIPEYKIDYEYHTRLTRQLAGESIVLLKNNGILPLKSDLSVTVTGEFANDRINMLGCWCLDGNPKDVITPFEGIKNNCKAEFSENLTDGQSADAVIVCLGDGVWLTGEANSVAKIEIPQKQLDLIKTAKSLGRPVIAVLFYGRPAALEELEPYCDAIVYAWHLGTQAGNAVADVLFGNVNPSGKLPMTLPRSTGQIPLYYNVTPAARQFNGYYGHCRRSNYLDCQETPFYPFGFGMSYSEFEISNINAKLKTLSLSDLKKGKRFIISVDVKNISNIQGSETVQLYLRDNVASMTRPLRELKGYIKTTLKSNETKTLEFALGYDDLGFYGANSRFAVEAGEFDVFIGNSCLAEDKITIFVTE